MSNKEKLDFVRDALVKLYGAKLSAERLAGWGGLQSVLLHVDAAYSRLDEYRISMEVEEAERMARFNAAPVLQARLRFRDGATRRVVAEIPEWK